ncbi:lipocalin family protein [Psychroserpens algicola]|uniref:lipocalin family protein n=1 Tax=Psychroserpens algicola TaxID=1719034 RepID=UPI001953DE1F
MKKIFVLLLLITLNSCAEYPATYIPHIAGYWEIEKVTLNDGSIKEYTFNDTIDYIQITDSMSGLRKKLKPNLMGTFETSKSMEIFSVSIENDSLYMHYKTPYANWKETVLKADETQLIILNANKDMYLYKRYKPLDLE